MTSAMPISASFNSGELSPRMAARVDFDKYPNAAETAENIIALPQGGFTRRPGTRYVASTKDNGEARLIPFEFNTEQAYIIEFGSGYMRFYRNQGQIVAPNITAAITNGGFDANINDWDSRSTGSASISWKNLDEIELGTYEFANSSTRTFGDGVAGRKSIGLRFNSGVGGTVSQVKIDLSAAGTPFDCKASIYSNNSGSPGVINGSASDTLTLAAGENVHVWASGNPVLAADTIYWVVLTDQGTTGSVTVRTCADKGTRFGSGDDDTITSIVSDIGGEWRIGVVIGSSTVTAGTFDLPTTTTTAFGKGAPISAVYKGQRFINSLAGSVSSVRINIASVTTAFNAQVALYTDSAGSPGVIVGGNSDSTNLNSTGDKTFTWSSNAPTLSDDTHYWLVFSDVTGTTGRVTLSSAADQGSDYGQGFHATTITSISDTNNLEIRAEVSITTSATGGALALNGSTTDTAKAEQDIAITETGTEHVLVFRVIGVTGDSVKVSIGSATEATDILDEFVAYPGYHMIAFDPDGNSTVYLQFSHARGTKTIYVDDVSLLDNAPIELPTDFTIAEVLALDIAQSADVMYMASGTKPLKRLERRGHSTWSLIDVQLEDGPWLEENETTASTLDPSSAAVGVGVTVLASGTDNAPFRSGDVGRLLRIRNAAGDPGYAVITKFRATTEVVVDILRAFPDAAANHEWRLGAFSDTTGHPTAITFYEQRLVLGGTTEQPQTFWMSQSGDIDNFRPDSFVDSAVTVEDDDATDFTISATKVNKIQWLASADGLVIGTSDGEWIATSSQDSATITPTDITVRRTSSIGSTDKRPVFINNALLFIQRAGRKIYEFQYSIESDGYRPRDTTILASHIGIGGFTDIDYQANPDSTVYAVRSDGILCALAYQPEHNVVGWTRLKLGGSYGSGHPVVESCAVIPGADGGGRTLDSGDRDEVWTVVKRTINGATKRYIEFFEQPFEGPIRHDYATDALWKTAILDAQKDAFYVDCGLTYDGTAATTITGLDHLEGQTVRVLGDGVVQADKTVSGGSITITSASKVQVGLGYTHKYKSLKFPVGNPAGTGVGQIKRIDHMTYIMLDSHTFEHGNDRASVEAVDYSRDANPDAWTAGTVFTGERYTAFPGKHQRDARIYIESDEPLPWTLLAIAPEIKTNARV